MKADQSPVEEIITVLQKKHTTNLIAVYGIGSYFDSFLSENFVKNDIDLIAIVQSAENLPKFIVKNVREKEIFVGYNTIKSYQNKKVFEKQSGANYEWSLICIKHSENSILLYGTDIREQLPDTENLKFDYDNILIRGFYHLEKSYKNGLTGIAQGEYSKALLKFGYYLCIFHEPSFRLVSLSVVIKKLENFYKKRSIETQFYGYFEKAVNYRQTGKYDSDFSMLRKKTTYYMISMLKKGIVHKQMSYDKIMLFFSKFFGGLPFLTVFVRNKLLNLHISISEKKRKG